ncbi:MAG: peptidoglycan D,D-transpeptidase FtsI family protein [Ilumatobacteraceae bacterium]
MAVDRRSSRLGMLAMVGLVLVGALGTRLWFLQGVQAEEYQQSVDAAKQRTVYLPPERGRIFDADGRIVADNQRVLTVTVEWSQLRSTKKRDDLFKKISGVVHVPIVDLQQRYADGAKVFDPLLPFPLVEDVTESSVEYLLERASDYPGVDVTEQWKRVYPYAPLASHVIGYMGSITSTNLEKYLRLGYNRNERVGQFGVESSMEDVLHGKWGKQVWEIDAAGNTVRLLESEPPVAGQDIQLTIDLDLQQYAEEALETQLKKRRDLPTDREECQCADLAAHNPLDPKKNNEERVYSSSEEYGDQEWIQYKAPAGSVVVLNHMNGQVLAMASYPTFDNRWFNAGISKEKFDQLFPQTDDPDLSILVNRAVQGRYNIGSTMKPFVAWSAMHSGLIKADDVFMDQGTWKLSIDKEICASGVRCEFKNANDPYGRPSQYGPIQLEDALAVSSDAFFYRLGEQFYNLEGRRNELKSDLELFGFGADTGIDLPYEWDGRIPDDAVKANLVELGVLAKGEAPRLVTGDLVQVAIGQGLFASTPLQLARAYAAIANGGFVMRPHLVKNIFEPLTPDLEGAPGFADLDAAKVVESFANPEIVNQLEMPPDKYLPILAGLKRVICGNDVERDERCGVYYPEERYRSTTGESVFRDYPHTALPLAGKTGTAQGAGQYPWNDSSVFAGFSTDETKNKPYTVVAYLEKAGYGSKAAAPVVKCMFTALAGKTPGGLDPVLPSDPLDVNSPYPAPPKELRDTSCLGGYDGSVRE